MGYTDEVLADAPLAYWTLGDLAGPPFADSSGNGRALTSAAGTYTLGAPSPVLNDPVSAVAFAGGRFSVGNAPWMSPAAVTVEAWVVLDSLGGNKTIVGRNFSNSVWILRFDGNEARFYANDGNWTSANFGGLQAGVPYHVVGVHTGTQVTIYVNGVQGSTANSVLKTNSTDQIDLGSHTSGGEAFLGVISHVAIYPSALSGARVAAHYAAGLESPAGSNDVLVFGSAESDAYVRGASARWVVSGGAVSHGQVAGTIIRQGTRTNRAYGRQRRGAGTWSWQPPVVPYPDHLVRGAAQVTVHAFGPVTMQGAQPAYDVSSATVPKDRYRIIVSGMDVTFFRDVPVPDPSYQLAEPLLWAVGALEFPQIAAAFEELGTGALWWLRDFAPVVIQRVDVDGNVTSPRDFVGFIVAFDTSGSTLRVELGGEASGRAALMNKQPPIFQRTRDIGVRAWQAIDDLNLRLTPRLGPVTGITCERFGGTTYLDHIRELTARSWKRNGRQWCIMPNADGVYRFEKKDDTTVHGTVFADDNRIKANLRRDLAEEPNRIYATGVTPEGMRVKFGVYPGLQHGKAAPYPFNDGRSFGTGTTNEATDTGDGVSLLIGRLHMLGYLDQVELIGGYDFDVSDAVTDLQRDADLPETGRVNRETWDALYDLDVTGYSLGWSQIQPAAQRSKVRKWRYSASGAVMGRNPRYRRSAIRVDRNIDMGTGFTRNQIRGLSVAELHDSDEPNYVGTIEFAPGIGLLAGDVPVGATIDEADVLDPRDLRPGMNLRLPLYAGGIFVHIAGVNVDASGSVTAAVDTRFRDAAEVWQIITRNREARRHPGRYLSNPHRSSTIVKDSITEWDEIGGILDRDEKLGAEWTVFPVVAGQEGTIARLRMHVEPAREFVVAVFGQRIHPNRLASLVGNPLTKAGSKKWESEAVRDRLERDHGLLYVAGDDEQPCGYFPKTKAARNDDDSDDAPLTGRWEDDAGFAYRCPGQPVIWVAVWAGGDTKLPAGRIMWPQLEAGV